MAESIQHYAFTELLPLEGAIALEQALKVLDWRRVEKNAIRRTMFGQVEVPFSRKTVQFANGDMVEIPWGRLGLRDLGGDVQCEVSVDDDIPCFQLNAHGTIDIPEWQKLIQCIRDQKVSLYKGRAIRMKFDEKWGEVLQPEELRLATAQKLIFNHDVEEALNASIFTLLEHTAECRKLGIPLKRGIVLEGAYGMGKSLTATMTAKKAIDNKWTFIMVPQASWLPQAFKMAQKLAPCVVFVEDVDEFLDNQRENINTFLNIIDGIESKSSEIMTIYSTNFVDSLDRAFLRPGRVDALVTISAPNLETVGKLITHYGGKSTRELETALSGASPAIIREAVERAKLLTIRRKVPMSSELVLECAKQLDRQRGLMLPSRKDHKFLDEAITKAVKEGVKDYYGS